MKKNLLKKIGLPLAFAGVLAAASPAYGESSGNRAKLRELTNRIEREDEIAKELKVQPNRVRSLRNGYFTNDTGFMDLGVIAGVLMGTIKVKKIENGYATEGNTPSLLMYPEVYAEICKKVDTNTNQVITDEESRNLKLRAYEFATRGNQ